MTVDVGPLKSAITRWATAVHGDALDAMPDLMRPYAPLGATGKLRRSIAHDRAEGQSGGTIISGRIVATAPQAKWTDQGTSDEPDRIYPRKQGGLLVFEWHGRTVFARSVKRKAMRAKPWWRRALQATYGPSLRFAAIKRSLR